MRFSVLAAAVAAAVSLSACSDNTPTQPKQETQMTQSTNALLQKSSLYLNAPEFNKIKTSDFAPAFKQALSENKAEIEQIANNPDSPTFDNTLVALEKSGRLLTHVSKIFFNLSSVISDEEYQALEADLAPKLSAHYDSMYLNPQLFARVQSVYANISEYQGEDKRLIETYYQDFVRAGATLSDADKDKIREINSQLSTLSTEFSQNILTSFKQDTIVVKDKTQLTGLSESDIASLASAARDAGKDGYMITLVNTTRQPILGSLENRELREKIWRTSATRAMDTNGPVLKKLTHLRAEKAELLGSTTWADYVTANQMAHTPEAVYGILDDLAPKAVARAKAEAADIQAQIEADGKDFKLEPWDWAYYAEKVRKAKYDLDEDQIKPYFEFNRVLNDGLFVAMNKLYGISFKARKDLPVYHPDVLAFEVLDTDGSTIGLFYLDPYAREGKGGGAWMDAFISENGLFGEKPVVYNVLNIPKPAEGQPTLLTYDEVSTLFHEFGHALHGLFSKVKYPSLAGTNTARDFVEFPSQFNEDWAIQPQILASYAKHYQTGEAIPDALLQKVLTSHKFNQGFDTTEYLAAALLDMEWHSITADTEVDDVEAFEQAALAKHGINYRPVPPRYKSAYFSHSAGGYSAGYYAYLWTEVFAADAFAYMQENGGLTRENGDKFRKEVLSRGNSRDLMQDYIEFRGQKPTVDALLKRRGLN
ncbi:M3 family metallopeptidase [Neptunicella marina]|uniref:Dipeptidyl carboxypeptidase n=1 Tax=Neptunicella marina TaxID=2125989 RepID=A0A8J6ISS7_9ALTE|nr:M3 family metallopeptidase [Neptunicella marina]MBC3765644.1 M3 family metallopeptidase [Neptunicella marina]